MSERWAAARHVVADGRFGRRRGVGARRRGCGAQNRKANLGSCDERRIRIDRRPSRAVASVLLQPRCIPFELLREVHAPRDSVMNEKMH